MPRHLPRHPQRIDPAIMEQEQARQRLLGDNRRRKRQASAPKNVRLLPPAHAAGVIPGVHCPSGRRNAKMDDASATTRHGVQ